MGSFLLGVNNVKKIAVISALLEDSVNTQYDFNRIVSNYKDIIKGRMGIPFNEYDVSVITLVAVGDIDEINSFTGKLGNLKNCTVKTSISKKEV
jgi:putative iron-only hydrogenase system regulator